jgi:hypothetical protein
MNSSQGGGQSLFNAGSDRHPSAHTDRGSAELRDHGAAGVEAQVLCDGELVIGRRFDMRELATRGAEQERQAIERGLRA